jgi:hypothetical protein
MGGRRRGGGQLIRTARRVVVREINCLASAGRGRPDHRRSSSLPPARLRPPAATPHGPLRRRWITTRGALPIRSASPRRRRLFFFISTLAPPINPHLTHPQLSAPSPLSPQLHHRNSQNASQSCPEDSYHRWQGPGWQGTRREEGGRQEDRRPFRREEEAHQVQERDLLFVHLQG